MGGPLPFPWLAEGEDSHSQEQAAKCVSQEYDAALRWRNSQESHHPPGLFGWGWNQNMWTTNSPHLQNSVPVDWIPPILIPRVKKSVARYLGKKPQGAGSGPVLGQQRGFHVSPLVLDVEFTSPVLYSVGDIIKHKIYFYPWKPLHKGKRERKQLS